MPEDKIVILLNMILMLMGASEIVTRRKLITMARNNDWIRKTLKSASTIKKLVTFLRQSGFIYEERSQTSNTGVLGITEKGREKVRNSIVQTTPIIRSDQGNSLTCVAHSISKALVRIISENTQLNVDFNHCCFRCKY